MLNKMFGGSEPVKGSDKNPIVFMDITQNGKDVGKLKFELYGETVPKTAENFRSLCAGDNK